MSYEVLWRETCKVALPPSNRLVRFILSTSDTASRTIFIVSYSQSLSSVPSSLFLEGRKLLVGLAPHILPNGIGYVQATKTHRTEDSVCSSELGLFYEVPHGTRNQEESDTGNRAANSERSTYRLGTQ